MLLLTLDLKSSAELLGAEPDAFLEFAEQEGISGILKMKDGWRVSIFSLAALLNTSAQTLLDLLEDYGLGQLLDEVEDDDFFAEEEGKAIYKQYLVEAQA